MAHRISLLARWAFKDLLFDRKVSFFIIASLVAVIAPLLLLFSLKYGVVYQLQQRLLNDPQTLEIKINGIQGNRLLDSEWFYQMERNPHIGFILPLTRQLNNEADLRKDRSRNLPNVELVPTDKNDPLMKLDDQRVVLRNRNGVILSEGVAETLKVKKGDEISLFTNRILEQRNERAEIVLKVDGILPKAKTPPGRKMAFVSLDLLLTIEDYKDGFRIEKFVKNPVTSGEIKSAERNLFSKARIYAKGLDNVYPIAQLFKEQGIETITQDRQIAEARHTDYILSLLFGIIASVAVSGAVMSLAGSFLANIERKRRTLSLFGLFGLTSGEIRWFLLCQAVILASLSFFVALGFFSVGSSAVNILIGSGSEQWLSLLEWKHIIIAFTSTLLLSAIVAFWGGRKALLIQPAESLREI